MIPELMDCTFRDGGYYTDWDFDRDLVNEYLEVLSKTPVKFIELGYRSPAKKGYAGEYFYLPRGVIELAKSKLAPHQSLAIMLNAKDCEVADIGPLLSDCLDLVQLVRLAVAPDQIEHGLKLAAAVKALGMAVAVNLMHLSNYKDSPQKIDQLADDEGLLDFVFLVDSYGACFPNQVGEIIAYAKQHLSCSIGFHGHNNLGLAFACSLEAISAGADMVDSTLLGMGRGAGNLQTELILLHLANETGISLNLMEIAHLIDRFAAMKREYEWGMDLPYIVSAYANLPQSDVMEWLSKKRYSSSTIVQALQGHSSGMLDDAVYPSLSKRKSALGLDLKESCVIIGGGISVQRHWAAIAEFSIIGKGVIVHSSVKNIGYFKNLKEPQIICLAGHEADKLTRSGNALHLDKTFYFVSRPPRFLGTVPEDIKDKVVQSELAIIKTPENQLLGPVSDIAPLSLALEAALDLGVKEIYLAGFDGYEHPSRAEQGLAEEVQRTLDEFVRTTSGIQLSTLTPTLYNLPVNSVYAELMKIEGSESG